MWALTDITGGISIRTKLNWDDPKKHELFRFLYENQKNVILTSTILNSAVTNGLIKGHSYSLVKLELVVTSDGSMVRLLNIRNPHGKREFIGDWSDNSAKWDLVDRKLMIKKLLQSVKSFPRNCVKPKDGINSLPNGRMVPFGFASRTGFSK